MQLAWLGATVRRIRTSTTLGTALRSAVAAAAAWAVVQPIEGVVEDYPYYAPFGAVVAVSTTVVSSVRGSVRSICAILLGAGTAVAADLTLGKGVVTVALVVGTGTLLGSWQRLGARGSWVPISALFVLILGHETPGRYVLAYAGLTALGMLIGVAVNLAVPPLPLTSSDQALGNLRDTLSRQFDDLADSLESQRPLRHEEADKRDEAMDSANAATRSSLARITEAQRANWRARRRHQDTQRQNEAALALEQLPFIIEQVTAILVYETSDGESIPWSDPLRPSIAGALAAAAEWLRSIDASGAGHEEMATLSGKLRELADEVQQARTRTGDEYFGVASIITTLRRALTLVDGDGSA